MKLSITGQYLADARAHLIQYMKDHPTPVTTQDLLAGVKKASPLPFASSDNNITRDEAYRCMITSEQQKRNIVTSIDYLNVWHEYADAATQYRGFVRD